MRLTLRSWRARHHGDEPDRDRGRRL